MTLILPGGSLFSYTRILASIFQEKKKMIYLNNIHDAQPLFIPRNGDPVGPMRLSLKNTIDQVVTIDNVIDLGTSCMYYNIAIALPEGVTEGEYEYALMDDGFLLSSGLLMVVGNPVSVTEYNKTITYEQYKAE